MMTAESDAGTDPAAGMQADQAAMARYYARRAAGYERIFDKPERQADLRRIEAWLPAQFKGRRVLEIACGTGWWTSHGARDARRWLATDLNPQPLALARAKPMPACVEFAIVDAFALDALDAFDWPAAGGANQATGFDAAFAGFWWSHLPLARLSGWLAELHARLQPGARVVMLDNRFVSGSSTPISRVDTDGNSYQWRSLDDNSRHEVLKNFPNRQAVLGRLGPNARDPEWIALDHYWLLAYRLA